MSDTLNCNYFSQHTSLWILTLTTINDAFKKYLSLLSGVKLNEEFLCSWTFIYTANSGFVLNSIIVNSLIIINNTYWYAMHTNAQ